MHLSRPPRRRPSVGRLVAVVPAEQLAAAWPVAVAFAGYLDRQLPHQRVCLLDLRPVGSPAPGGPDPRMLVQAGAVEQLAATLRGVDGHDVALLRRGAEPFEDDRATVAAWMSVVDACRAAFDVVLVLTDAYPRCSRLVAALAQHAGQTLLITPTPTPRRRVAARLRRLRHRDAGLDEVGVAVARVRSLEDRGPVLPAKVKFDVRISGQVRIPRLWGCPAPHGPVPNPLTDRDVSAELHPFAQALVRQLLLPLPRS